MLLNIPQCTGPLPRKELSSLKLPMVPSLTNAVSGKNICEITSLLVKFLLQNIKINIKSIKFKSSFGWPLKASKDTPLDVGVLHFGKWVSPQATQRIVSELPGHFKNDGSSLLYQFPPTRKTH